MARRRRGVALAAALGLLMLAAALLAGSAIASVELRRATRGLVASARARAEARRAFGEILQGWNGAADSLPVGATLERAMAMPQVAGPPVTVQARVRRLSARLYVANVSVRVGGAGAELASRRTRLLLARAPPADSGAASRSVVPLARWSVVDLH
jgi:hypothetical protein